MNMERVLPRQTSTGLARGVQQLGSPNVYVDSGNEQIIVAKTVDANSSNPQVLMGNQPSFGEGFYVTKPGIDVTSAKSNDDFIFNSNQNVFKIVKTGFISVPGYTVANPGVGTFGSNGVEVITSHGLDFVPAIVAYLSDLNSSNFLQLPYSIATGGGTTGVWINVIAQIDETNITVDASALVFGSTTYTASNQTIKYFLLQETLQEQV